MTTGNVGRFTASTRGGGISEQDGREGQRSGDQVGRGRGPFQLWEVTGPLGTTPKGGVLLRPERARTYDDLNDNEKKRFDADVRATNIVLQGLPKDIYKLINHNIEAKAIWDNMLPGENIMSPMSSSTACYGHEEYQKNIVVQNVQGLQNQNQSTYSVKWVAAGFGGAYARNTLTEASTEFPITFQERCADASPREWSSAGLKELHSFYLPDLENANVASNNDQIQSRGNTIRELKEKISRLTKKNSDADPIFDLKALVSQNKDLTAKLNALHDLNERFRAENAKVKQHYKELYDSIKITRAKTTDQNNSLLSEIENLKGQLKDNSKCVTIPDSKPKVLAPGRYPIDVEPIPPRHKNNREVHLHYIKHLKESVETLREIVEDAKNASTTSLRKKRVTFVEPCETSTHNTPAQVEHQKINLTNAPGIPSTGVKGASAASRSKPRSNTKKDRTLPAKSALKQQSPATKVWRVKQVKQVWKATGKLFTTIGHQWRPTGRLLPLGDQWPLTRNTPPKVLPTKQWKPTGRLLPLGRQCPLVRSTALKSDCMPADPQETIAPVVQIVLWYLDSGCSKHMTGDRSRLRNFVKKFIGTVRFGNDHFGAIMGYGDYVIGDSVISRVYYVEGLGHNLFSVGQFCDSDLEVAFRKHTCFVRDLDGVDLIKGSRGTNLYTISVEDMMRSSPICLLSKASKNKSWLWHRRLNHLNFGTLNDLARKDLVRGLPRLKFEKDHLCSACQLGKSRKATHKPKTINTIMEVLHTLHMDLCGPLRVQSINGKKYILVIVDDYSRFTWVKFLRSKDETPAFVINLLKQLQVGLNKTVRFVRTDNGTEFVNKDLTDYYESVGITHEKTVLRTPQQNGVVERRNCTLVEAARTMLIFSKAPLFLWAEAVATACYTQNRSLIHTLHDKTPYELVHDKKPDLSFIFRFFVFFGLSATQQTIVKILVN
ncbi:retrovirus-related pol polyprotein from transposon TNT 1-94 [Tanacetum coccineum]